MYIYIYIYIYIYMDYSIENQEVTFVTCTCMLCVVTCQFCYCRHVKINRFKCYVT